MPYEVYANTAFYNNEYKEKTGAEELPAEETMSLLFKASRLVDRITLNRSQKFDELTEEQQTAIKYAVCAQAEYEYMNGDSYKQTKTDSTASFSLGKFSYNNAGQNSGQSHSKDRRREDKVSPQTWDFLKMVGLTYRGVSR